MCAIAFMMRLRPSLAYSLAVTLPSIVFFGSLALLVAPFEACILERRRREGKWGPSATLVKMGWARWMLWSHGLKTNLFGPGANKLKSMRGTVFVANHQSAVDILVMMDILSKHSSFIAKKELRKFPVFGWAAGVVGTLFIDRSRGTNNKSLDDVSARLQQGLSVIIFPEGTRSADGKLLPFKRGAFVMAIDAQVPIVPIVIMDSRFLCPKGRPSIDSGTVHIWVGDEISTIGLTKDDRHALSEKIALIMAKQLENFFENRKNN